MTSTVEIASANNQWESHLLQCLQALRRQETMCNAVLITRDGHVCRAHAAVLAGASPVMKDLLQRAAPRYAIAMQMVSDGKLLEYILDFIYEGKIRVPINSLVDLQKAAHVLKIDQLSDLCSGLLEGAGILFRFLDKHPENKKASGMENQEAPQSLVTGSASIKMKSLVVSNVNIARKKTQAQQGKENEHKKQAAQVTNPTDLSTGTNTQYVNPAPIDMSIIKDEPMDGNTETAKSGKQSSESETTTQTNKHIEKRPSDFMAYPEVDQEDVNFVTDSSPGHSYGTRGVNLTTLRKSKGKTEKVIDIWSRKQFNCPLCPSAFTRRDNLKVHLKKHEERNSVYIYRGHRSKGDLSDQHDDDDDKDAGSPMPELSINGEDPNDASYEGHDSPAPPELEAVDSHPESNVSDDDVGMPPELVTSDSQDSVHAASPVHEQGQENPTEPPLLEKQVVRRKPGKVGKQLSESKRFQCSLCRSSFTRHDNLRVHMRSIHTGAKPFECDICKKSFTRAFTLKYHRMSHFGERPWTCSNCGRGFVRRDYYLDHLKSKNCLKKAFIVDQSSTTSDHNDSQEEMDRLETSRLETGRHLNLTPEVTSSIHDDSSQDLEESEQHECEICHKVMSDAEELETHVETTHMQEGFYVCHVCSTRFSSSISLEVHLMQHKLEDRENAELQTITAMETAAMDTDSMAAGDGSGDATALDMDCGAPDKFNRRTDCDEEKPDNNNGTYAKKTPSSLEISQDDAMCDKPSALIACLNNNNRIQNNEDLQNSASKGQLLKDILLGKTRYASGPKFDNEESALDLSKARPEENEDSIHNNNNVKETAKDPSNVIGYSTSFGNYGNVSTDKDDYQDMEDMNSTGTSENFEESSVFDSRSQSSSPALNISTEGKDDKKLKVRIPKGRRQRSHSSKPYRCDLCGARFTRIDNMKVHRKRHDGEKEFVCVECGQAFTRKATLKKHETTAHGIPH